MAHYRTAIRNAIVSRLTGLVSTGSRVYPSRVYPIDRSSLPGLVVYTKNENIDYLTVMGSLNRTTERTLEVGVEAYVKAIEGYDTVIDTITSEVEVALATDNTLGGLVKDAKITGIDIQFSGDGDQPIAGAAMTIEVTYTTAEGSPTV